MNFVEYQKLARETAIYPNLGNNYTYPVLGLCGETGEIAEKIKKVMRDNDGAISAEMKDLLAKELGDVIWYVSNLANELGLDLDGIAVMNIAKLHSRKQRGMLQGSGDNR